MNDKKVKIVSIKENFDLSTPNGKLMLTMIAAINEFEREIILERQREGIAIAKREGKYKGGKEKKINQKLFEQLYDQYSNRIINKTAFAKGLGISRPTLDRILKQKKK